MKKLISIAFIILFLASEVLAGTVQQMQRQVIARKNAGGGGQSAEWFGRTDCSGSTSTGMNNMTYGNKADAVTVPGTGSRNVSKMAAYVKSNGGVAGHMRLALSDTSGNIICQGAAETTVESTTAAYVEQTGLTCAVTGGTTYRLIITGDSADVLLYYLSGSTGDAFYRFEDFTGGFGATIDQSSDGSGHWCLEAYVDAN